MRPKKRQKQNRPPTKPKPQPPPGTAKAGLPSPETLAMIAATCSKGGGEEPGIAVAYAAKLYRAACDRLDSEKRLAQATEEERATLPIPPTFPASYDEFLRLVVKGKTIKEGNDRFREYWRDLYKDNLTGAELENAVALNEKEYRRGFHTPDDWLNMARKYVQWWAGHKSEQAITAASKRKLK